MKPSTPSAYPLWFDSQKSGEYTTRFLGDNLLWLGSTKQEPFTALKRESCWGFLIQDINQGTEVANDNESKFKVMNQSLLALSPTTCSDMFQEILTMRSCFSSQSKCFRFRRGTEKLNETKKQGQGTSVYLLQFYASLKTQFHKEFWNTGFISSGFHHELKLWNLLTNEKSLGLQQNHRQGCVSRAWAPHGENQQLSPALSVSITYTSGSSSHQHQPVPTCTPFPRLVPRSFCNQPQLKLSVIAPYQEKSTGRWLKETESSERDRNAQHLPFFLVICIPFYQEHTSLSVFPPHVFYLSKG